MIHHHLCFPISNKTLSFILNRVINLNDCKDCIGDINGNSGEISHMKYVNDTLVLCGAEDGHGYSQR